MVTEGKEWRLVMSGFVGHCDALGFYIEHDGQTLKGFVHTDDI